VPTEDNDVAIVSNDEFLFLKGLDDSALLTRGRESSVGHLITFCEGTGQKMSSIEPFCHEGLAKNAMIHREKMV
jgi:hypothetical protein